MQISFSGKIPIYQGQVYHKRSGNNRDITLYEYDLKDEEDIDCPDRERRLWRFGGMYRQDMEEKFYTQNEELGWLDRKEMDSNRFFIAKVGKEVVGICETDGFENSINIKYIETEQGRSHRYPGMFIMASIAKDYLKKYADPEMTVKDPLSSAMGFYVDECGFGKSNSRGLKLDRLGMQNLVEETEARTNSRILDLNA